MKQKETNRKKGEAPASAQKLTRRPYAGSQTLIWFLSLKLSSLLRYYFQLPPINNVVNYIKITMTNYLFPRRDDLTNYFSTRIINQANSSAYDVYNPTKIVMRPTNLLPLVSNQRNSLHTKMNIFWEEDPCDLFNSDKNT